MANDTRSSRGSKDDENNSSIKKPVSIKESSTSGSAMMDTSGFRKSIREMPLQKQMSSSPSTRSGSEHLDRPTPTTFAVKRKSEIVEKLRRSDRDKEHASLGCSGSMRSEKGSGSPDDRRKKLKSDESVKELMRDSMETSIREKISPHTNGRTYKSLIKLKRRRDTDPGTYVFILFRILLYLYSFTIPVQKKKKLYDSFSVLINFLSFFFCIFGLYYVLFSCYRFQ